MFIVLEGVDCTGKSTTAKLLSESLQAVLYSTPPKSISGLRESIDKDAGPQEHYNFYAEGNRIASDEIREILLSGNSVVCDRYWLTTYIYHRVMGLAVKTSDFSNLVQPDLTVLLTVSAHVQARRFLERGMSAGDRRMLNSQAVLAHSYMASMPSIRGQKIIVDTDHLTPSEVVSVVKSHI